MIKTQRSYNLFTKMYSPAALHIVQPYLAEENQLLQKYLKFNSVKSLICVGCGPGKYQETSKKHKLFYVGIDPVISKYFQNYYFPYKDKTAHKILIKDVFENVYFDKFNGEIPKPRFWIFTFNVVSYIKNFWDHIRELSFPGDIFFISVWSSSSKAKILKDKYYQRICDDNKMKKETKEYLKNHHFSISKLTNIPITLSTNIEKKDYCNIIILKTVS